MPEAKITVVENEVIAYMHKLSVVKRNRRNTMDYLTLLLQTENDAVEALPLKTFVIRKLTLARLWWL